MPEQENLPVQEESIPVVLSPVDDKTWKWQKSLLPLMKKMLIGTSIFFFVISFGQLIYLHVKTLKPGNDNVMRSISGLDNADNLSFEQKVEAAKFKATYMLENESMQRRHHQSNVLLMSRTWIKYLGFVTGMILALVGAVFILGKLEERSSEFTAKTASAEVALKTASPGIFLAVLGTGLMIATIFTNHTIEQTDAAIYINSTGTEASSTIKTGKADLPEPEDVYPADSTINQ